MGTPLDDIFNRFYSLIKDTDFCKLDDEDLYDLTKVYYEMAATRFKECKKNLELVEDDFGDWYISDTLTLEEKNIIAQGMILYWVEQKVNYNKMLKNVVNTKDYQQLSPANILLRMQELLDYYRREFNRLRKAYTKRYGDDWNGWS